MKKETNLCMGCMSEKGEDGVCPACDWADKGVYLAPYLYPSTFLADRYIVGKLISYNGEGAVYMGFDCAANKKVTVKEYMPDALCSRERGVLPLKVNAGSLPLYKTYLSEFIELNRSLQTLCQNAGTSGLQEVADVFTENNTAYAVYEHVSGISLKSYLQNFGGTIPWEQAKPLLTPVMNALSLVNSSGIVHRGVCPQTVFISEKSEARLIGFAISAARTYGSEINYEVFSGYAAPELYNLSERQGSWTDVYGLSALLYRVLTGLTPPDAPERLINDTLAEPIIVNRDVPANISVAIAAGLELSRGVRVKTVDALSGFLIGGMSIETAVIAEKPDINRRKRKSKAKSTLRKKRERRKKIKRIAIISSVTVIIALFAFLIAYSAINPDWLSNLEETSDTASETPALTTTAAATSPTVTVTEKTVKTETPETPNAVPDFLGRLCPHADAERSLIEDYPRLKLIFIREYSDDAPKGRIFFQSVGKDVIAEDGAEVILKISLGKKPPPETETEAENAESGAENG